MAAAGSAMEVGFVFQCALCGTFCVFVVDALDPAEVARRATGAAAAAGHLQKTLQRDVHTAELELLEQAQQRLAPASSSSAPPSSDAGAEAAAEGRWATLPCSACTEILSGQKYVEWLEDRANLDQPAALTPHAAVTFEAGELPPAYVLRAGKWCLGQGVGPKDLELRLPNHLPAGQFRQLLPPAAPPVRPLCWQKEDAKSEQSESPETWSSRQALIEAIAELAASPPSSSSAAPSTSGPQAAAKRRGAAAAAAPAPRAPPIGAPLPWLEELLEEAAEAWSAEQKAVAGSGKRKGGAQKTVEGARYVKVPLMRATDTVRPLADAQLQIAEAW